MGFWASIIGSDKKKKYPEQNVSGLGKNGSAVIIFPYGLYADLPDDALTKCMEDGACVPVTVERPTDSGRGEPVFFHPATKTRIIARNDGTLDIITGENGSADVNVKAKNVNVDAEQVNLGEGGNKIARLGDSVEVTIDSGSSAGTYTGTITSSGVNTSI